MELSVHDGSRCRDVILDIEAELEYWHRNYRTAAFHRTNRAFDDYIPTLKFGYDMYLLGYQNDLEDILPSVRHRYHEVLTERTCLEWSLAEAVIRETWQRMRPTRMASRLESMASLA